MCVCLWVCARVCVLTGRFQRDVPNVDVDCSAHQNRVVARCKEEEDLRRGAENPRAREGG